jgi:hypothetical protein
MAYGLIPLINGKQHEWADITLNILGVPFGGATSIEYSETQAMKNVMAAGNRPYGRIYGEFTPTAKVNLLAKEVENIQSVAVGGVIQNIPEFNIIVTFVDAALIPVKHTLRNCRFMTNSRKSARGDGEIEVELELIISHIEFQ